MKKRLLATLLTLCMVLTMLPTAAFAVGDESGANFDGITVGVPESELVGVLGEATKGELTPGVNRINPKNGPTTVNNTIYEIGEEQVLMISGQTQTVEFQNCTFKLSGETVPISGDQDGIRYNNGEVVAKLWIGGDVKFDNCLFVTEEGASKSTTSGNDAAIYFFSGNIQLKNCKLSAKGYNGQFLGLYGSSGAVMFNSCDINTVGNKNGWSYAMYGGSVLKLNQSTMTATGMSTDSGNTNAFYSGDNKDGYDAIYFKDSIVDFSDNKAGGFAINNVNIRVDNSQINVSNNAGNGCNSGYWIVSKSDITMNGNRGGHALSCIGFEMTNSDVKILHNGYAGVYLQSRDSSFTNCEVDIRCNGEKLLSYSAGDLWLNSNTLTVSGGCSSDAQPGSAWLGGVGRKGAVVTQDSATVVAYDLNSNAVDNLKSNTAPVLTGANLVLNGANDEHTLFLNPFMESAYARGNAEKTANNNDADLFKDDRVQSIGDIIGGDNAKIGTLTTAKLSHHIYDWANGERTDVATLTNYGVVRYTCTECASNMNNTGAHPNGFNCAGTYVYAPLVGVSYDANAGTDVVSNMPSQDNDLAYGSVPSTTTPVRESGSNDWEWMFTGWYMDSECTQPLDPDTGLTANWTILYAGWQKFDTKPGGETADWDISKSKTATNLDENNESQITLSLPAAEEELVSDVVFVLDESSCSEAVKDSVADMLNNLYQQIADTDATIKIGAVQFRGEVTKLPLTELTETTKDAVTEFMSKRPNIPGSNMSAGLLAGEKMLDEDNTVDNSRKYLILISDGITYIWDDETTETQENYGVNFANADTPNQAMLAGPDGWDVKHGTKYVPNDWSQELAIIAEVMDKTITDKASHYGRDNWDHYTFVAYGEKDGYASTVDVALYKAYELYQNIASKYHSYAVMAGVESDMDYFPFGPSFMNYLADGKTVSFKDIQKDIYYLLDKGSTVEDYMGYVADDYNFDFVNDKEKLSMKVGDVEHEAVPLGNNQYGFVYFKESEKYDYVLTYVPGNLTSNEHFVWEINVPVSNFAPVQLIYSVKLVNPKTAPGTYGTYDADGSKGYNGLYTNNKAILTPVDSNGDEGLPEAFPKPTVSYTVDAPINSLTISKTVNGTTDPNVLDDEFTFTVQLPVDESPYSYRYTAGNDSGKTGTIQYNGTLTLQSGETVVIDGVPVGSQYTVSETANRDFQTTVKKTDAANVAVLDHASAVSATGTIGVGGASAVHFVNTYSSGGSSGGGSTSTPGDNDGPGLNKQDHIAYVSGYPDGTVQPNGYITREEVATMFFRLLTDASRANYITNYNPFPDVARERWSFYSITTMNNADIMTGRTNGMFDPGANITRAEFAVVAAQFSKAQYTGPDKFSDISDHWARDYINRAAAEGWIAGYPDGTFGPERYITRAEVMALVNEVLDRAPDADYMLEDMIRWPDNPELTWYYEDVQEATNSHSYVWRNANHTVEEWKKWIPMRTYDQMVRDAFNGVGIDR